MICNTTFVFDLGHEGLALWDQYTWGCRIRYPPTSLKDDAQQRNLRHEEGLHHVGALQLDTHAEPILQGRYGVGRSGRSNYDTKPRALQNVPSLLSSSLRTSALEHDAQHKTLTTQHGAPAAVRAHGEDKDKETGTTNDLRAANYVNTCPSGSIAEARFVAPPSEAGSVAPPSSIEPPPTVSFPCQACPSGRYQPRSQSWVCYHPTQGMQQLFILHAATLHPTCTISWPIFHTPNLQTLTLLVCRTSRHLLSCAKSKCPITGMSGVPTWFHQRNERVKLAGRLLCSEA